MASLTTIVKRDGRTVPFDREKVTVAIYKAAAAIGGHDRGLSENLSAQVVDVLEKNWSDDNPPTVEDIQDIVEQVLIRNGHAQTAKAYIVYRHERSKMRKLRAAGAVEYIPYKMMWQTLDWNVEHGCARVADLNETIRGGRLPDLVAAAEARYESMLDEVAEEIAARSDEVRFIIVAGPSSSGKTTTTVKVSERLERSGLHVIPMALDNYFFDLELHPKDEFGDHDFETPEAMDLKLINEHLGELDAGRGIDMPQYDFKIGKRGVGTTRFEPEPGTLILLDTLHGLFRGLTRSVPDEHKYRVYIETISQLKDDSDRYVRWTDIRLLRRMLRDSQHRGYSPEQTILHWHYVRRSELKHIIPHQGAADFVVNGSFPYELAVLKKHLFEHFPPFLSKWANEEKRVDAYLRAERIHRLLDSIETIPDESIIPATSLLREFIGGSAYSVH